MRRRGRNIDGILLLDKPRGITSNGALQRVKRLYFAAKAGHTGSLDPLATGVLPICLGEATKFSQYLIDADKAYRTTVVFGVTTATGDADGEELSRVDASALDADTVERALVPLRGEIAQVPPMYSAIKRDGQPLYKLARAGVEVEREARRVVVHELVLEAFRPGPQPEADLYVRASKGTYVRSIAEDLGRLLGVGAHVVKLRRVMAGRFSEADCVTLEQLEMLREQQEVQRGDGDAVDWSALDALLQPPELAVSNLPDLVLAESTSFYLRQGQPVLVPKAPTSGLVQLHAATGEFLGIGEILDDGRVAPRRLVVRQ
jgi:tRNA pseudouridine55 synthase